MSSTAPTTGWWRRFSSERTRSREIAAALPEALGDQRGSSDAINAIAGQMQALLASDVIYLQRTVPRLVAAYDERGIEERFPTDRFLPDLGWLDPDTVQTRLGRISGGDEQSGDTGAARHRHPERHCAARRCRAHRERRQPRARERPAHLRRHRPEPGRVGGDRPGGFGLDHRRRAHQRRPDDPADRGRRTETVSIPIPRPPAPRPSAP